MKLTKRQVGILHDVLRSADVFDHSAPDAEWEQVKQLQEEFNELGDILSKEYDEMEE